MPTKTIEEAIVAKLGSVMSSLVGTRIYPDQYPQPTGTAAPPWPCVVYQRAGDDDLVTLDGHRSSIRIDTYTVEIWSDDRAECETGRNLLKAAFSGSNCRGYWGGDAGTGVFVCGAVARDATSDAEPPIQGDEELDRTDRLSLVVTWNAGW